MHWMVFVAAVVASTVVASFTDWLFMGVLFHDRAKATPEIWRALDKAGERNKIILSTLFGAVSCAAFAWLCVRIGALGMCSALCAAGLVWLAAAAPLIATNAAWIRMDRLVAASHAVGWLVRLAVTGVITALLVHPPG